MKFDDLAFDDAFRFPLISGDTRLYYKYGDNSYREVGTRETRDISGNSDVVKVDTAKAAERDGAMYGDESLRPDQRVELHPATDRWMRGDRFGTIIHAVLWRGKRRYHVRMDVSRQLAVVTPANLRAVS